MDNMSRPPSETMNSSQSQETSFGLGSAIAWKGAQGDPPAYTVAPHFSSPQRDIIGTKCIIEEIGRPANRQPQDQVANWALRRSLNESLSLNERFACPFHNCGVQFDETRLLELGDHVRICQHISDGIFCAFCNQLELFNGFWLSRSRSWKRQFVKLVISRFCSLGGRPPSVEACPPRAATGLSSGNNQTPFECTPEYWAQILPPELESTDAMYPDVMCYELYVNPAIELPGNISRRSGFTRDISVPVHQPKSPDSARSYSTQLTNTDSYQSPVSPTSTKQSSISPTSEFFQADEEIHLHAKHIAQLLKEGAYNTGSSPTNTGSPTPGTDRSTEKANHSPSQLPALITSCLTESTDSGSCSAESSPTNSSLSGGAVLKSRKLVEELRTVFKRMLDRSLQKLSQQSDSLAIRNFLRSLPNENLLFGMSMETLHEVVNGEIPNDIVKLFALSILPYACGLVNFDTGLCSLFGTIYNEQCKWSKAIVDKTMRELFSTLVDDVRSGDYEQTSPRPDIDFVNEFDFMMHYSNYGHIDMDLSSQSCFDAEDTSIRYCMSFLDSFEFWRVYEGNVFNRSPGFNSAQSECSIDYSSSFISQVLVPLRENSSLSPFWAIVEAVQTFISTHPGLSLRYMEICLVEQSKHQTSDRSLYHVFSNKVRSLTENVANNLFISNYRCCSYLNDIKEVLEIHDELSVAENAQKALQRGGSTTLRKSGSDKVLPMIPSIPGVSPGGVEALSERDTSIDVQCDLCERTFSGKSKNAKGNRARHWKEQHAGHKKIVCPQGCGYSTCKRNSNMKKHLRTVHKIQ